MKWMIYGDGSARDHATYGRLVDELGEDAIVFALEGANALLASEANVYRVDTTEAAVRLAVRHAVDRVLILSPAALISGVADMFHTAGMAVAAPFRAVAELEASKHLGKRIMAAAGISTPSWTTVRTAADAERFLRDNGGSEGCVIKSDRFLANAAIRTCLPDSEEEARRHIDHLLSSGPPDERSETVLLERRVDGTELSLHAFCSGGKACLMPPVRDYKRLEDGGRGPNTHGMGAVGGTRKEDWGLVEGAAESIVLPSLRALSEEGLNFCGVLYVGLMINEAGTTVLEYNVRPGNPEWLVLLALLESPLWEVLEGMITTDLGAITPRWHADNVGMASFLCHPAYPFANGGAPLSLSIKAPSGGACRLFGEDIMAAAGGTLLAGFGRVLCAATRGGSVDEARSSIDSGLRGVSCPGLVRRRDIGLDW